MQRLRTIAVVGALLAIVATPFAYANGLWFGLPVVGGPGYCSTFTASAAGTDRTCVSQVPAGTSVYGALTGGEMIPADVSTLTSTNPSITNLQNAGPQTVFVPVPSAASGAYLLT